MFPGLTTRLSWKTVASAATVVADKDLIYLTGTTAIDTLTPKVPNLSNMAQVLFIIPSAGTVATTTNGNIIAAQTMLQNRITTLVYYPPTGKWYPHALS